MAEYINKQMKIGERSACATGHLKSEKSDRNALYDHQYLIRPEGVEGGGRWLGALSTSARHTKCHLPAGLFDDGPSIGSPDSRFHVMFGFGEPLFRPPRRICFDECVCVYGRAARVFSVRPANRTQTDIVRCNIDRNRSARETSTWPNEMKRKWVWWGANEVRPMKNYLLFDILLAPKSPQLFSE